MLPSLPPQKQPAAGELAGPAAFWLAAGLVLVFGLGLTVALYFFVTSHTAFSTDFFVYWSGAHDWWVNGRNPYSLETLHNVQLAIYGRLARPDENQMWLPNPPYSLFPLWPIAGLEYAWAQAAWLAGNFTLWLVAVRLAVPRAPVWLALVTLLTYPVVVGLLIGQFAMTIASLCLLIDALLARPDRISQWLAGGLLAWITIKPLLVWLLIPFFLLLAWRARRVWVWVSFVVCALAFIGLTWLWLPDWPRLWLGQVLDYAHTLPTVSSVDAYAGWLLPAAFAPWVSLVVRLLAVGASVWFFRAWWRGQYSDMLALGVAVWLTQMLHVHNAGPEQIVCLFPALLWTEAQPRRLMWSVVAFWSLVVIGPWIVFGVNFHGREPQETVAVMPAIFTVWLWSVVWFAGRRGKARLQSRE